ncbi:MAG: V-type ATPase subunit [Desulfurococcales archaeon]|nr:V-type ATPase subunit [Desulfurococcales archaeon]
MTATPGPSKYATVVPSMRVLKSKLVGRDRIRELVAQPSLEEALSLLKDTVYGEAIKSSDIRGIQRDLYRFYCRTIESIKKKAPKDIHPLLDAFKHEVEAGDIITLAIYSAARAGEIPELVTGDIGECPAVTVAREPEALVSLQRYLEYLQSTWASKYADLLKRAAEGGDPSRIAWTRLAMVAGEYSRALEELDPRLARPMAAKTLCPILDWTIAAFLVQAKKDGMEPRLIEEVLVDVPTCRFSVSNARTVYEREPGPEGLAGSIDDVVRTVRIDVSKDLVDALEEARIEARKKSLSKAIAVYSSYPFHAGLVAAGLVMFKINLEDLLTVLTGIALRLDPEEYLPSTTLG